MCSDRLFSQRVDLFVLKFYLDRVVPGQPFWHQKTRDTGLPYGEDRIPFAFPRFDTIPECDGRVDKQTDERSYERTDGFAVVYYTALAKLCFALRCKNVN